MPASCQDGPGRGLTSNSTASTSTVSTARAAPPRRGVRASSSTASTSTVNTARAAPPRRSGRPVRRPRHQRRAPPCRGARLDGHDIDDAHRRPAPPRRGARPAARPHPRPALPITIRWTHAGAIHHRWAVPSTGKLAKPRGTSPTALRRKCPAPNARGHGSNGCQGAVRSRPLGDARGLSGRSRPLGDARGLSGTFAARPRPRPLIHALRGSGRHC